MLPSFALDVVTRRTLSALGAALLAASGASLLSAQTVSLAASMDGLQEVPAVSPAGSGSASITLDVATGALTLTGSYSGMTTTVILAHIHGPAPVGTSTGNTFIDLVPTGGTSGTLSASGILTAQQVQDVLNGLSYVNVHTTAHPTGEIRGQICELASATFRNSGANPASYTSNTPVLGQVFTGSVDLTTTGHNFAFLFGFDTQIDFGLAGGQRLLCIDGGSGEFLAQALTAGPIAVFNVNVPNDVNLCGFEVCTQALHIGGVIPYALSNAQDLVAGL
jgi:hypothetical protein